MKLYEVWMGGYKCTGNSAPDECVDIVEADNPYDAIMKWSKTLVHPEYFKPTPSYWDCGMWACEVDAKICYMVMQRAKSKMKELISNSEMSVNSREFEIILSDVFDKEVPKTSSETNRIF